jgi:hypothetical protein
MQPAVFLGVLFLTLSIVSYFAWKRYDRKDYLWFGILAILGFTVNAWDFITKNVLQLPFEIRLINGRVLLIFWIIFIFAVVVIALKQQRSK